jgi:hypothetical protein
MTEHAHTFGRGANGRCRECGEESNAGRKRREARENKPAEPAKPFDLYAALKAKGDG